MSSDGGPSLDDLIRAHRSGVRVPQRAANRARLTSRLLAGSIGAAGIGGTASSAVVSSAGITSSWLAKAALGIVLAGGAGAAYLHAGHTAPVADKVAPQPPQTAPAQIVAPPAAAPVSVEPASRAPVIPGSGAPVQVAVTRRLKRASPPGPATAPASLAVEVQLMHDVDAALKSGHAEWALALLDERREGDGGYMREERAAARVFALCQLGRVESARAAASRFLRDRPRSPLATRVKATCSSPPESALTGKSM